MQFLQNNARNLISLKKKDESIWYETGFPAKGNDAFPNPLDYCGQEIRPNVRVCGISDSLWRTSLNQLFQYFPAPDILCPGMQFPIRERARTAFPKLYVAFGLQDAGLPKSLHITSPLITSAPRSTISGRWPACAKIKPANNPAGPIPTTTGLSGNARNDGKE